MKIFHFSLPYIAQGGYREMMGVVFMVMGFFLRKYKEQLLGEKIYFYIAIVVSILLFTIHPTSMNISSGVADWMVIPFSGITGTYAVYFISNVFSLHKFGRIFAKIGEKTMWILALHLLVFKLSELIEIYYYGLPIQMVGCHPIIPKMDNWFFIIHTGVGITIPVLIAYGLTRIEVLYNTFRVA